MYKTGKEAYKSVMGLSFIKMHGLGNDFVIFDGRQNLPAISREEIRKISDRKTGVGCDQLIVMESPKDNSKADVFMRIFNPDGSEAEACGNAARCVGSLLLEEGMVRSLNLNTKGGLLSVSYSGKKGFIRVEMATPKFGWRDIPLSREEDTLRLNFRAGNFDPPAAVNVGNPHVVFFVPKLSGINLPEFGYGIETDALFPERANVGMVEIVSPHQIKLKVWERGTGMTQACGSGACAATVAAIRRGLTARTVEVVQEGGNLIIEWPEDTGPVIMSGPVSYVFSGVLSDRF